LRSVNRPPAQVTGFYFMKRCGTLEKQAGLFLFLAGADRP
jgi:hypothetical protein